MRVRGTLGLRRRRGWVILINIKTISVEKINPAPYNPRKDLTPGDKEYQKIKRSITEFGLVEPLVWNEHTGTLVGGHQRFKILKELGHNEVPVSVVKITDLRREKAMNIALNKAQGEWEMAELVELLVALDDGDFDATLTAYDEQELQKLIDYQGKKGLTEADNVPNVQEKITKPGDIWVLGGNRLLCGDSTNPTNIETLMDGELADMVFTDPPYNVDYEGYTEEKLTIQNDKMTPEEFKTFLNDVFFSYRKAVKDSASLYVCHPSSFQREFQDAMEGAGFKVRSQLIWAKNTFGWGHGRYKFQHEPIFYGYVADHTDEWYGDLSQSTLWREKKPAANRLHPTMKPVELVSRALINSTRPGDVVLDLFGGSGSTLIAAEQLQRPCRLMELDEHYCDVIVQRWQDFTGQKAERMVTANGVG